MKNDLKNIDHVFLKTPENNTIGISSKKVWKSIKIRLLINELKAFNFVNVRWKYWYYTGAILILISFFTISYNSKSFNVFRSVETNTDEIFGQLNNNNDILIEHNLDSLKPKQSENHEAFQSQNYISSTDINVNKKNKEIVQRTEMPDEIVLEHKTNIIIQEGVGITKTDKLDTGLNIELEPYLGIRRIMQKSVYNYDSKKHSLLKHRVYPPYHSVGINIGSVFIIDDANLVEKIQQPIKYASLSYSYNTQHFFVETAFELSTFKSEYHSTYLYDTLLGRIPSYGFNIVEVVNEFGDTLLERQYHSELLDVYDTLSSNDQVVLKAKSTMLCIPINVGTKLFQYGKFHSSISTGIMLKVLIAKNQSYPQFGQDYRRIIDYEVNPTLSFAPELYFQGGLSLGCFVSKRFNLEFKTIYSQIIRRQSSSVQNSKSNIKFNFGVNYMF